MGEIDGRLRGLGGHLHGMRPAGLHLVEIRLVVGSFMEGAPIRERYGVWLFTMSWVGEGALSLSQFVSSAFPLPRSREPRVLEDRRQTA